MHSLRQSNSFYVSKCFISVFLDGLKYPCMFVSVLIVNGIINHQAEMIGIAILV